MSWRWKRSRTRCTCSLSACPCAAATPASNSLHRCDPLTHERITPGSATGSHTCLLRAFLSHWLESERAPHVACNSKPSSNVRAWMILPALARCMGPPCAEGKTASSYLHTRLLQIFTSQVLSVCQYLGNYVSTGRVAVCWQGPGQVAFLLEADRAMAKKAQTGGAVRLPANRYMKQSKRFTRQERTTCTPGVCRVDTKRHQALQ